MMTIGNQLRKTRILIGLTQKQMSDGIMSEPFYSRIENDRDEINICDLIKILNKAQVSMYDFFQPFECKPIKRSI